MDPILKIIAEDPQLITYRPNLRQITGSVTATILLQQILFRWQWHGRKPFYKFKEPCTHKAYRKGDSWEEELGFAPKEFDNAIKKIGYKKGKNKTFKQMAEKDAFVVFYTDKDRMTWYEVNEQNVLDAINGIYSVTEQKGDSYTPKGGILSKPPMCSYPITENTSKITTENTTCKAGKCNVDQKKSVGKSRVGKNNVDDVSLGKLVKKEIFAENKLFQTLCNRDVKFKPYNKTVGDVKKFRDRSYRKKYPNHEYADAISIYNELPDDNYHKIRMTNYIEHESKKWDFSKTKNKDVVYARFILEYILWNPIYQHFQIVKEKGLLEEDIANFDKRHTKVKKEIEVDETMDLLEAWGQTA